MRDQHRPKQDLINEVIGLRKQVADLKQAAVVRWRAEEALRRSEEQYRALVEYVPGGICRLSPEGEFLQVNGAFAAMLGYETRGEATELGRVVGIFADEAERERVLDAFRMAEGVRNLPARLRHRDGRILPVRLSGRAVREPTNGRTIQSFAILITPAGE
ncbi:MAG: PAS domain S-box protein [Gemmatimonadota bacterium]